MGPGSVKLLERMREEPDGGASPPSKSATGEVGLEGGPGVVGLGPNKLKMSPFWPRWWADTVCVGVIGGVAGGACGAGAGVGLKKSSMAELAESGCSVALPLSGGGSTGSADSRQLPQSSAQSWCYR